MNFLICRDSDTDLLVRFPYAEFKYFEPSEGRDNSIYSLVSLVEFYDLLKIIYRALNVADMELSGIKTLYIVDDYGEDTTSYITLTRTPQGCTYSLSGICSGTYTGGIIQYSFEYDDPITASYDSETRENGYRLANDPDGDTIPRYYYWTASGYAFFGHMLYIDKSSKKFIVRNIGANTYVNGAYRTKPYYVSVNVINQTFTLNPGIVLDIDPNAGGGFSDQGGGQGIFDGSSEIITIPGLPTLSAVDTGFVTLYNPSLAQLRGLASFMWSADLIDNIRKAFADPMDAILGLSIVPVPVPDGPVQNVRIGNVTSDIIMTTAASQYVSVDCGTLQINEYWGSALDYSPNTKAQLILPYIGAREIDVDEIMGKSVHIVYHVDILTGACVCFVSSNGSVIYQFEGSCANQIPITGSNWTQVLTTAVQVAGNAAAFVATAGGSGAVQASTAISGLANTAGNVMNSKPRIEHSGNVTGGGGQMSVQVPYLIIQRPRQSLPVNYNQYEGYPSNITAKLADLRGFTSIESIHLEGVNATDQELEEIQQLLRGGVII